MPAVWIGNMNQKVMTWATDFTICQTFLLHGVTINHGYFKKNCDIYVEVKGQNERC